MTILQSDATDVTAITATVTAWRRLEGKSDQRLSALQETWPRIDKTPPEAAAAVARSK